MWYRRTLIILVTMVLLQLSTAWAAGEPSADFLTPEEHQWLVEHPTLRLGVGISFPPYQWVVKDTGEHEFKGMVADYVNILENRLQVKMQIVFGIPFNQALALGKNKEIDLFPCLAATPERSDFLLFTQPYISYPSVIITRDDAPFIGGLQDLRDRKVSAVKDLVIYSTLKKDFSHLNLQILATENSEKDLEAVSFGKVDACLMDLGVASYLIQKLRLTNLKVAAPAEIAKVELAMGVRKDWPILQTIVEKALATISQEEKAAIHQRWIQLKYEPGIAAGLVARWAAGIGFAIVLILAGLSFWNKSLAREITKRKKIEEERNTLIAELRLALSELKVLQGFLPICASCKKIRNDTGYWQQIDKYLEEHTHSKVSHSICPDCIRELYPTMADKIFEGLDKS